MSSFTGGKYYGLSAPGVWLLPCYLPFPIMQCLGYIEAILDLELYGSGRQPVWKPGRALSLDARSLGRVPRDLGCCKKGIFPIWLRIQKQHWLGEFDSVFPLLFSSCDLQELIHLCFLASLSPPLSETFCKLC